MSVSVQEHTLFGRASTSKRYSQKEEEEEEKHCTVQTVKILNCWMIRDSAWSLNISPWLWSVSLTHSFLASHMRTEGANAAVSRWTFCFGLTHLPLQIVQWIISRYLFHMLLDLSGTWEYTLFHENLAPFTLPTQLFGIFSPLLSLLNLSLRVR